MRDSHDREDHDDLEVEIERSEINEPELEDIEENSVQKIKKLQKQLREAEKEKLEHLENLQRAKAEFLNAKRRLEEERIRDKERAVSDLIEKLLPLCDSFTMAQSNKEAWEAIDATWRKGIESIQTQLQTIIATYGVTEINPLGAPFDPTIHEAMANVPVHNAQDHHKVMQVVQNGFIRTINGKETLLRPARVTVGEYQEA